MKKYLFLCLSFWSIFNFSKANVGFSFGVGYSYFMPIKDFKTDINNLHGANVFMDYRIKKSRFSVGIDADILPYNRERMDYSIETPFGTKIGESKLNVRSSFSTGFLYSKIFLFDDFNNKINPYLKLGVGFNQTRTSMLIQDIISSGSNFNEVNETLHKNASFLSRYNLGFSIDLSETFAPEKDKEGKMRFLLNIEGGYIMGRKFNYLNKIERDFLTTYNHNDFMRIYYDDTQAGGIVHSVLVSEFESFLTGDKSTVNIGNINRHRFNAFSFAVTLAMFF